jgi:peptidase E
MSRLFLASSFNQTINLFIQKFNISSPDDYNVAFIDIAADPYKADSSLSWVIKDRDAFLQNGFNLTEIDLRSYQGDFSEFQIIHFCGGHTRYLLAQIHKLGLYNQFVEIFTTTDTIYTGSSAGSMIAAPSLVNAGKLDDTESDGFTLEEQKGLNLVNFLILPHFEKSEFVDSNIDAIKNTTFAHPYITLSDNQAIVVVDNKFEIVEFATN